MKKSPLHSAVSVTIMIRIFFIDKFTEAYTVNRSQQYCHYLNGAAAKRFSLIVSLDTPGARISDK
jgi:hypothetical protein